MNRTKVDPNAVEDVIFGCCDTIGAQAGDHGRLQLTIHIVQAFFGGDPLMGFRQRLDTLAALPVVIRLLLRDRYAAIRSPRRGGEQSHGLAQLLLGGRGVAAVIKRST